jgi:hypothetical protein
MIKGSRFFSLCSANLPDAQLVYIEKAEKYKITMWQGPKV